MGVRFGDESTTGRRSGQNGGHFQTVQLLGAAQRAINLQFIAHRVDLHDVELAQHGIEDLRQTKSRLSADHETCDRVTFQNSFAAFVPAPVGGAQNRKSADDVGHGRNPSVTVPTLGLFDQPGTQVHGFPRRHRCHRRARRRRRSGRSLEFQNLKFVVNPRFRRRFVVHRFAFDGQRTAFGRRFIHLRFGRRIMDGRLTIVAVRRICRIRRR